MTQADGTETFQDRIKRQRDQAAVTIVEEMQRTRRQVEDALRLGRNERLGDLVELAPDVTVAEVIGGHLGTVWRHVVNGKAHFNAFENRWTAILDAIATWNGAGDGASLYAGRVLLVEEPTR
jgi:hypothetical protein